MEPEAVGVAKVAEDAGEEVYSTEVTIDGDAKVAEPDPEPA